MNKAERFLAKDNNVPRIMLYAHNGNSFGHIARMGSLAAYIKEEMPQASVALVSGSRHGGSFTPEGVDYLKLPSYTKTEVRGGGVFRPLLDIPFGNFLMLRRSFLKGVFDWFSPQVFIADTVPEGSFGELSYFLAKRGGRINVLATRGFMDSREKVRAEMYEQGLMKSIQRRYDHVFCFMDRKVFDMEKEYDLQALADKTVYCGYILRRYRGRIIRRAGRDREKRILAAVGGGGGGFGSQAFPLLKAIIQSRRRLSFPAVYRVFTGAYITPSDFQRLKKAAPGGVSVERFTDDMIGEMLRSDLFVGAGGYNQLAEVLCSRVPSLIVPWQFSEDEQLNHTRRLHALGAVTAYLKSEQATPRALAEGIERILREGIRPKAAGLDLNGGRTAARHIRNLIERGTL